MPSKEQGALHTPEPQINELNDIKRYLSSVAGIFAAIGIGVIARGSALNNPIEIGIGAGIVTAGLSITTIVNFSGNRSQLNKLS